MDVLLTIGEFSKMTYLSVKALRHYHDVGLLEPVLVDPLTGYRRYAPSQVATAQAIRRFRELDMPLDEVRNVLQAPDVTTRNQVILAHLERMHRQLEQTQATVASLHALLSERAQAQSRADVAVRRLPVTRVLAARAVVAFDDCAAWLEPTLDELGAAAASDGLEVTGAAGALYPDEFFEQGTGRVTAFVPVRTGGQEEFPATTVAVLVHEGPFADLDQAYATLGTVVAEQGIGGRGPIREHYIGENRTEVCWPVIGSQGPSG